MWIYLKSCSISSVLTKSVFSAYARANGYDVIICTSGPIYVVKSLNNRWHAKSTTLERPFNILHVRPYDNCGLRPQNDVSNDPLGNLLGNDPKVVHMTSLCFQCSLKPLSSNFERIHKIQIIIHI